MFFSCIVDSSNTASLICILSIIEFTFSKTWLGEEVSIGPTSRPPPKIKSSSSIKTNFVSWSWGTKFNIEMVFSTLGLSDNER